MANRAKGGKKIWIARFIFAIIIVAALMVSTIWSEPINRKLGLTKITTTDFSGETSKDEVVSIVSSGDLKAHFVDVGQGDACILELPDDKKMIIDGGKDSEKDKILSYIDNSIKDADGSKLDYFDYSVLTHSDEDHCGGLDDVLRKYPAKVFYRPNILGTNAKYNYVDPAENAITANSGYKKHETKAYVETLKAGYAGKVGEKSAEVRITDATNEAINVIKPEVSPSDPNYYTITFYAPTVKNFSNVNNYSPIIILDYQGKRMALSGDAEKEAEESFVSSAKKGEGNYSVFTDTYSVNVIKLGHHGSRTASTAQYLETLTTPDTVDDVIIIVSCALVNSYGHPHKETLDRLIKMGFKESNILSTAKNGSVALAVVPEVDAAGGGKPQYNMYVGGELARFEEPSLKAGKVKAEWTEIAVTLSIIVVFVLLIVPFMHKKVRPKRRAAKRKRT